MALDRVQVFDSRIGSVSRPDYCMSPNSSTQMVTCVHEGKEELWAKRESSTDVTIKLSIRDKHSLFHTDTTENVWSHSQWNSTHWRRKWQSLVAQYVTVSSVVSLQLFHPELVTYFLKTQQWLLKCASHYGDYILQFICRLTVHRAIRADPCGARINGVPLQLYLQILLNVRESLKNKNRQNQ